MLEAPVLGWRVLCASGGVRHKVKRGLQRLKYTPTPNVIVPPPTQVHMTVKLEHPHIYSLPLTKLEPSLSAILLHMSHVDLLEKAFKFTFKTLMHHSVINPEMPVAISKTNHMQKIQTSSNSLFFIKQTVNLNPYSRDANALAQQQVFTGRIISTPMHMLVCVEFACSHSNWFSVHHSHKHKQAGRSASKLKPCVEATGCSDQVSEVTSDTSQSISEYFWTTELFPSPFLFGHTSTVRTFVGEPPADTALPTLSPSPTRHSVYPSLPLTPDSYSVAPALTHEVVDRKSLASRLTPRPHPKETPLRTGSYRAGRTDSESQPTLSSLGKSAADHFYMTIWDCSGCLVTQVICCNDLTPLKGRPQLNGAE